MDRPNFEEWKILCEDLFIPDIIIESCFYALVGAALQRRVWMNDIRFKPIFPNVFMLLVTPPGKGKGLCTDLVKDLLSFHKVVPTDADGNVREDAAEALRAKPNAELRIPVAPPCVTYEQLVHRLTATRSVRIKPPIPAGLKSVYMHNSMTFVLDEITSIFREDAKRTVTFLLTMFNCKDYEKDTRANGNDTIVNPCISILGGTQPDTFVDLMRKDIVSTGLLSRFLVVYAPGEEKEIFRIPAMTQRKEEAMKKLNLFVFQLSNAFGQIHETDEAVAYTENWIANKEIYNRHPQLITYYARKNQHLQKMAMIVAYSENAAKPSITAEHYSIAADYLRRIEKEMHKPFLYNGKNPIAACAPRVLNMLRDQGDMAEDDIFAALIDDLRQHEVTELLQGLVATKKIQIKTTKIGGIVLYSKV